MIGSLAFRGGVQSAVGWSAAILTTLGAVWFLTRADATGIALAIGALLIAAVSFGILKKPFFGILLVAFLLPFERVGSFEVAGSTLRLSQILGAIAVASWLLSRALQPRREHQPNPVFLPTLLFLAASAWSVAVAENRVRAVSVLLFVGFTIAVSWAATQLVSSRDRMQRVCMVLFLTTLLVCAYGVFQFIGDLAGLPPSVTGLRDLYTSEVFGFPRVQSTTLEPLYFANFLLIPLSLAAALLLGGERKRLPLLALVVVAALTNIVLTLSRGGWIAAAVSLAVVAFIYLPRLFSLRRLLAGVAIAVVVAVGFLQVFSYTQDREFSLGVFRRQATALFEGASYFDREETFRQAADVIVSHPWLGVGIGNFGPQVAANPNVLPERGWLIVNNEFLEVFAETGIVGFTLFLLVLAVLAVRSLRALVVVQDPWARAILAGLFAAFVGTVVQYQTFSTLYIMHIWFLIGLLVAAQNLVSQKKAVDSGQLKIDRSG